MLHLDALPPVVRGLLSPAAYGHAVDTPIELIQTHISYVLLAGEFAYKIKKPLNLRFLDYSTLEQRRRMCEEEVRLNRRLCKEAYLGVVPISRLADAYRIGDGDGAAVEYAVHMRRMPADRMMPALLERGAIDGAEIRSLARLLAGFHAGSQTNEYIASYGRPDAIRENWYENFRQVMAYIDRTTYATEIDALRAYADATIEHRAPLFHRRADARRVRDCHGDLRSDAVVFNEDGTICVMDCIEFNDRIRYGDVAGDIGFLAMDLDFLGHRDLSDELIGSYLGAVQDESLPLVLPFYKCYRAFVRGKVESLLFDEAEVPHEQRTVAAERAKRYFALALEYASANRRKTVVVMAGLTGSGKSHLANALGSRFEAAIISSDAIRDELMSRSATADAFGAGRYGEEERAAIYAAIRDRADRYLRGGDSVILDATHVARRDREAAYELARSGGARPVVVHVRADDATTRKHMEARAAQPDAASEGRWEIYQAQRAVFEPVDEAQEGVAVVEVDGGDTLAMNVELVLTALD